jgi:hypothetical protein
MTYIKPLPTPKRTRQSIRLDAVNPSDFLKYDLTFACEHCSHFDASSESCTLGYNNHNHRKEQNLKTYSLNGKMAFCRFLEID